MVAACFIYHFHWSSPCFKTSCTTLCCLWENLPIEKLTIRKDFNKTQPGQHGVKFYLFPEDGTHFPPHQILIPVLDILLHREADLSLQDAVLVLDLACVLSSVRVRHGADLQTEMEDDLKDYRKDIFFPSSQRIKGYVVVSPVLRNPRPPGVLQLPPVPQPGGVGRLPGGNWWNLIKLFLTKFV